jgi:hypothetical protein
VVLIAAASACSRTDKAPAVATVTFQASKPRVALGSPIDLTYRFDVAPDAKFDGDYTVFVHVLDSDNKLIWTADHVPPIPTSQWKPGQTIGPYTRNEFVPVVPYLGEAVVRVGLYKAPNGPRLPLAGLDPADRTNPNREYRVGGLQILPSSENLLVISKSGWNQDEYAQDNPANSWRWTQKLATMDFRNPKKDVTFYLEYDARPDLFGGHPQQVTIYSGDQPVTSFAADSTEKTLRRIPISAAQLGTGEMGELRLEVDKTFVPASLPNGGSDHRELGLRVYHVFVEPKG